MRKFAETIASRAALPVGLVAIVAVPAAAVADVSYSYVTDAPSYTGMAGGTVTVGIFLQETLTGSSTSVITADGGLTGAGAAVNVDSTVNGTAASIGSGSFTYSSAFSGGRMSYYDQGSGNNLEFTEAIGGGGTTVKPSAGGLVPLGSLIITVGTGTTTYELTSLYNDTINNFDSMLGQTNGNTVTTSHDLDMTSPGFFTGANAAPAYTFTVNPSAVPEPASLALVAATIAPLALRRRRRQQAR